MTTRGLQNLNQRGGGLANGTGPKKIALVSAPKSTLPHVTPSRALKNTTLRPSRITQGLNPPRKSSAPARLISAIGSSLDGLSENVTLRRKVSSPARSSSVTGSNYNPVQGQPIRTSKPAPKRAYPAVAPTAAKRKTSADQNSYPQRISKDHTTTTQNPGGTKGSTSVPAPETGPGAKPSKKAEIQVLPTVTEEKKVKSKGKKICPIPPTEEPGLPDPQPTEPLENLPGIGAEEGMSTDDILGPTEEASGSEKSNLERMVSDLIRNNEAKKQEIAVLKMEINRLKESVRERLQTIPSEDPTCEAGCHLPPAESCKECPRKSSDGTPEAQVEELNRLQSVVESLATDNRFLRDHLRQLGVCVDSSPLSDQQKEMVLSRVSTFPQSGEMLCSAGGGEKEWDARSCSSISEVSVACLQGRIHQMEETHYSTNEELQATLQELEDLREQLAECQVEVHQLQEEKQVILESLTQQTEKLTEARGHNDTLKAMLIQTSENSEDVSVCERTQRLMELLKSLQEDKELVQVKQEELEQQLQASKEAEERFHREAQLFRDRMKLLESMMEASASEKRKAETRLVETQELLKASEREVARLKTSLFNAKEKITELEAAVISGEKSELADVLERVRGEKESSEREVVSLQAKVGELEGERERLKDQVTSLQESLRVTRNNAKTNLDDVEWRRSQVEERRRELEREAERLKAAASEAQLACQRHLEDKRELKASLSEAQKKLAEAVDKHKDLERGFREEKAAFARQVEEWDQFQKDLLTSVRVANDFKTEAQKNLERIEQENLSLKDKLKVLDLDLEKAKALKLPSPTTGVEGSTPIGSASGDRGRLLKGVLANGDSILGDRRLNPRPLARGDSRVKSLIESIECATKQTKAGSRSSSTSSLASNGSENNNNNNNNNNVKSQLKRTETEGIIRNLPPPLSPISPLKESISNASPSPLRALHGNSIVDSLSTAFSTKTSNSNLPDTVKMSQLTNEKSVTKFGATFPSTGLGTGLVDPKPVSILTSKIEPIRRSSYNQLSLLEKKDPLASLSQAGGSKRNALLKWCQNQTAGYKGVDITNFSSSWNDGLALCALLHTYMPEKINYDSLNMADKRRNFEVAFAAAESVGIPTILDISDMITLERPTWQSVFNYVTSIFSHFET